MEASNKNDKLLMDIEIPAEFINGINDDIKFDINPTWLSIVEILPSLDPFPVESNFRIVLQEAMTCLPHQDGMEMTEVQKQAFKKVIEAIVDGVYDTEERYVWLICCVSRILLLKDRSINGLILSKILSSDVFQRYDCGSLYCPAKMHYITKELYEITRGNTFGIEILVTNLNHVSPVIHYICVCLVSAAMNHLHSQANPEVFQALRPKDLISMIKQLNLSKGSIDLHAFHELFKLITLYNSLVVMNKTLNETHPAKLVKYLTKKNASYLKVVKKWLMDSAQHVNRVMAKKLMSSSLLDLKQRIFIELQYGLSDYVDEAMLYRGN